jgi:hypothetical protein
MAKVGDSDERGASQALENPNERGLKILKPFKTHTE